MTHIYFWMVSVCRFLQLTTDISQALMWLKDHLPVLQDDNYGKDESTATTMLRKTTGLLNDVTAFNKTIQELNLRVQNMIGGNFCGQSQRDAAKKLQVTIISSFYVMFLLKYLIVFCTGAYLFPLLGLVRDTIVTILCFLYRKPSAENFKVHYTLVIFAVES